MEFITYRCLLNIIFFREFIAFRTFHNLLNDSNLAIHCWLSALERTYKNEQKLPDTLFYQIDGSSINACNLTLGLCELMVAKRLTRFLPPTLNNMFSSILFNFLLIHFKYRKIVVTRLLVGHTHEDIDAIFAKIWKKCRGRCILSPQQYVQMILSAMNQRKIPCEVIDVFVTPDYKSYLSPYISNISKAFKKQWTSSNLFLRLMTFVKNALVKLNVKIVNGSLQVFLFLILLITQ